MNKEKKDFWDKFKIVTSILIPVAIAYAGHIFAIKQQETELQTQQNQFEHHRQVSMTNSKVGQVGLVSSFFDALLSDSPKRKKLAIRSILIALPEEGPDLVKIVSESNDEADELKEFALTSLNNKRDQLVQGLFSEDKTTRYASYQEIMSGWKNDTQIATDITNYGKVNLQNKNGVYNALVTLSHLDKGALVRNQDSIIKFSVQAEVNGPRTIERAAKLRERLPEGTIN